MLNFNSFIRNNEMIDISPLANIGSLTKFKLLRIIFLVRSKF